MKAPGTALVMPRVAVAVAIAVLSLCVFTARARGEDTGHTPTKYVQAFDSVWSTINQNFYDPSFLGVNWAAVRDRYKVQLAGVHDDAAFEQLIGRMLRELPTSHLHFRPPLSSATTKIGVLNEEIGGENLITAVDFGSDAARKGVRPGDVLLTKDELLRGPWGSSAEVQVKHCDARIENLSIDREPFGWPFERPSVQWKVIARSAKLKFGYLRITHFEDDVAPLIDQAMRDMTGTAGIIIDLRNNTGGNASYVRLMSYFTPSPRMAFVLLSRPFLDHFGRAPEMLDAATLSRIPKVTGAYTTTKIIDAFEKNGGGAAFYTEDVGRNLYKGKVVLLVNKETASAAEAFAWDVKGYPGVTIIGHVTSGAIVGAEDFDIPGGWKLMMPTHAAWGANGLIYRDQKTIPDIDVPVDRASLCRGNDAAMDMAEGLLDR